MHHKPGRIIPLLMLLVLPAFASVQAATSVTVDVGWQRSYRAGRWTPLFLTITSDTAQQVIAEVYSPHGGPYALRIEQGFAIGPTPATYALYVPLPQPYQLREATVTLRDARSGRKLTDAQALADPTGIQAPTAQSFDSSMLLAGASGRDSPIGSLNCELGARRMTAGYILPARLPAVPIGYDALDLLVLNAPNFITMEADQQRAIADWVRAGGCLLMWPGDEPIPTAGPLVDILPCRFGDNEAVQLPVEKVRAAGLHDRFAKTRGRQLIPAVDALPVPLFEGAATGYLTSAGLGQVIVLPFDCGSLSFGDPKKAEQFWKPILSKAFVIPEKDPNRPYYTYNTDNRRVGALYGTLDWLGDVPGAGAFGFGYVTGVLLAMMVIIGPVDWFVLKWLGRQPWTWVTTAGWITLVTLGAIYIGHIFKSGDLHYRSVRLIDQVDDATVASIDLLGIYSPRTTTYVPDFEPSEWWQPAVDQSYSRNGMFNDIECHQDYRGSRPTHLRINVWNFSFLQGETLQSTPALVEAHLRLSKSTSRPAGRSMITGTITNHAAVPLTGIAVRTSAGVARYDGALAPGASAQVRLSLSPDAGGYAYAETDEGQPTYYYGYRPGGAGPAKKPDFASLAPLAGRRSHRLERLLEQASPARAIIYAEMENPPPPAMLHEASAIERHTAMVRAMVTLER